MPDITRNFAVRLFPVVVGANPLVCSDMVVGSGANRCLVVGLMGQDGKTVTSAFWNTTEAMTLIAGPIIGTGDRPIWLYYLLNPTSGAHDVTFNLSAGFDAEVAHAVDLENVRQSAQPDHAASDNSAGATVLTAAIVTTVDKCWTVAYGRENAGVSVTWGNATELLTAGACHLADSNAVITPAGAESVTATTASTYMTTLIAAAFAPADAPAAGGDVSWLPQTVVANGPAFITVPAGQIPPGS